MRTKNSLGRDTTRPELPESVAGFAFVSPFGDNEEQIRAFAGAVLDILLDYAGNAAERPPLPDAPFDPGVDPWPTVGQSPESFGGTLRNLLGASMNASSPGWVGHMNAMPSFISAVADFAISMLDNNMLGFETAPALTRLEHDLTAMMAREFGLPEGAGGVMVGGGSVANLQALTVARNVKIPGTLKEGLPGGTRPCIMASDAAHTSIDKAATILGLGTNAVRHVAGENGRMQAGALGDEIAKARADGWHPFAIVATAGTTCGGFIDDLPGIAEVAKGEELWLHVDAAYGGALQFVPEFADRLHGIDQADSITFDPHKWFYVARNCAMALFRDKEAWYEAFRIPLPYAAGDPAMPNFAEISVHGTQRADCLKLFFTLQLLGRAGLRALIEKNMAMFSELVAALKARPGIEFYAEPDMNMLCFRQVIEGISGEALDDHNRALQQALLTEDKVFLSLASLGGKTWLRAVWLNPYSGADIIARIIARLNA